MSTPETEAETSMEPFITSLKWMSVSTAALMAAFVVLLTQGLVPWWATGLAVAALGIALYGFVTMWLTLVSFDAGDAGGHETEIQ